MKGLLLTALSLFLIGTTNAQNMDTDDDGISNERVGFDGSPMPADHHHNGEGVHWNRLTTISINPLQFTESGVGGGISYERALEQNGIISLYVPFIAAFSLKGDRNDYYDYNNYNSYYYGGGYGYGNVTQTRNSYMLYAMPGLKFYPTGMGHVKYAIGPSAVIGWGQKKESGYINAYPAYYDPYNYTTSYYAPTYYNTTYNRLLFGMMINNSLNIQATPHLHMGVELGLGFTYYDRIGNFNEGSKGLAQGNFNIGYTF